MSTPGGIQRSNPTNLRPLTPPDIWQGQTGVIGGFSVFCDALHGIRAAAKNLRSYGRGGFDTIRQIYNRWAPAADSNNPLAYAQFVAAETGLAIDQVLDLEDQPTLVALIKASTLMENGKPAAGTAAANGNWYSDQLFADGVTAAFL